MAFLLVKGKQRIDGCWYLYVIKKLQEKSLIEMVPAVPKAFILNSLLVSKLPDSLFIINSFIIMLFLSMSKNTKKCQKCPLPKGVQYVNVQCSGPRLNYGSIRWTIHKFSRHNASIIHCSYEFSPCSTLSPLSACSIRKATGNPPC